MEQLKLHTTTITKLEGSYPIYSRRFFIPQSCLMAVIIVLLITRPVPESILHPNVLFKTDKWHCITMKSSKLLHLLTSLKNMLMKCTSQWHRKQFTNYKYANSQWENVKTNLKSYQTEFSSTLYVWYYNVVKQTKTWIWDTF